MITRQMISAFFVALAMVALVFGGHSGFGRLQVHAAPPADGEYMPWFIPICPYLALQADTLASIDDAASAQEAISYAAAALTQAECQCQHDNALNFAAMFIEDAIRRGTTLDAPENGIFYADLLQISAEMAKNINGSALDVLAGEGINLTRQISANINFVSGEQGILDISFPDAVSDIGFDNITVETEFAAITLYRGFISGNVLRIERGVPLATGNYIYTAVPFGAAGSVNEGLRAVILYYWAVIVDYWAVAAFAVILVIWGMLASMGKKLRLWVVPALAVVLIAANIWTLGPNQERPDDIVYGPAPVYFYSVLVTMTPDMEAMLSIPLDGANPEMLMLVNEDGEPQPSRYNYFTDTIDARIYSGGRYSLQVIDIRG